MSKVFSGKILIALILLSALAGTSCARRLNADDFELI